MLVRGVWLLPQLGVVLPSWQVYLLSLPSQCFKNKITHFPFSNMSFTRFFSMVPSTFFFFTWIKALGNISLEQINVTAFSQIDIVNKTKDSPTALHHSWNVTDMMQEAWYQLCKEGQTTQSSHMVYGWSLNATSMTFSWKAPICLWNVFRQSEAKKK